MQIIIIRKETPQERYDKTHTERLQLKFNKGTDADILAKLSTVASKQGYVKQLIRADIQKCAE